MTRLAVFGLPWSPNLGDGAIFEGLAQGVAELAPETVLSALDLAGRTGFEAKASTSRRIALATMPYMPVSIRLAAVRSAIARRLRQVEAHWEEVVSDSQGVVIGGGQLFADADLNFPLKVAKAADIAARKGLPVVIHAVGASSGWSSEGARLFQRLRGVDLRAVRARDQASLEIMAEALPNALVYEIAADPGVLAPRRWGISCRSTQASGLAGASVGLGVTHGHVLRLHGNDADAAHLPSHEDWTEAVAAIVREGARVTLFTNGAREDEDLLKQVARKDRIAALALDGTVCIAPRPSRPEELAETIAGFDIVAAHRLHALILAHGCGAAAVGFRWDQKVAAYLASAGRGDAALDRLDPQGLVSALQGELSRKDAGHVHREMSRRARAGIAAMLGSLDGVATQELHSLEAVRG